MFAHEPDVVTLIEDARDIDPAWVAPRAIASWHRGFPFELIRYAGHLPQIERPAAVNRAIEGFIERRRSWRGEEEELRIEN